MMALELKELITVIKMVMFIFTNLEIIFNPAGAEVAINADIHNALF
jgi:hypothetical protein